MRISLPRSLVLGGAIATSLCIGYALGAQPHMDEAIAILQSARVELGKAEPNKGGHREKAIGADRPGHRRSACRQCVRRRPLKQRHSGGQDMMRTMFAAALALGAITGSAQAMPLAPLGASANGDVIAVAGGCGAGWHRGPNGGCLRNYANPAAHACPRGYHIGPGGACRGNGR
ncbi:hypothetical protein ACVWYI_007729 [Bradyrhizobium sp. LB13.1]